MDDLKRLGAAVLGIPTDSPFYMSPKLDLDEAKQRWADQRSIQFSPLKIVLRITGNDFAACSAKKMNSDLFDAGTVLINGERVGLDLEIAEGSGHH